MSGILLDVNQLKLSFRIHGKWTPAVEELSFQLEKGKILGIVGESGCGKSVSATSILKLLPESVCRIDENSRIVFNGVNLVNEDNEAMRKIRGDEISMIFQDPMSSLNPVYTIGQQLTEMLQSHRKITNEEAMREGIRMLREVGIPAPEQRIREYPHQLSGGMRQRVMIAMALSCNPKLLIADEPTTALDVTIQAQILRLIRKLTKEHGTAVILITHDMGVVAEMADDVLVMYAGMEVEYGRIEQVFDHPMHPYTRGLLGAIPKLNQTSKEKLYTIKGSVPSLEEMPEGCRFCPRCDETEGEANCLKRQVLNDVGDGHLVRCWKCEKEAVRG